MVTPDRYNGFTFDGVNSKTYGVFITDVKVFGAPVRDVEAVSIPGRNGDLLIDHGRYENIDVVYSAVIHDLENFTTIMANFRSALASKIGYKRLSDDINIGEYRLATFKDGLDVSTLNKKTGQFDITFNCKPQRYLLTGESTQLLVQGMTPKNPQTEIGSIVSIEGTGADKVTSLVAQIEPVQAGSGDPSPSNVRPITGWTVANVHVDGKNLFDVSGWINTFASDQQVTFQNDVMDVGNPASNLYGVPFKFAEHDTQVTVSITGSTLKASASNVRIELLNESGTAVGRLSLGGSATQLTRTASKIRFNWLSRGSGFTVTKPQIELGTTATAYEPYKGTTYPVSFGSAGTVYGGTLDVVTGVLMVTHKFLHLTSVVQVSTPSGAHVYWRFVINEKGINGATAETIICNMAKGAYGEADNTCYITSAGGLFLLFPEDQTLNTKALVDAWLANHELQICYKLATPQTYQLTAQEVELLTGQNNVWADTGDITLTYGADPYKAVNPTLFESKPLLKVTGRGTLSVGGVTMTITGTASQVLYIDCDIMEVYSITNGHLQPQNSLVTISGNEYPTLQPGATQIALGSGITQVVITPRWWRI